MRHLWHLVITAALTLATVIGLSACAPEEPVRLGYMGGLSGRVTDLGIGGLNGVRLAVELRNKRGGINGRLIELIEEDDQQNPKTARQALGQLIDRKAVAVVGPMTSAMAMAIVPLADQAQLLVMSPTATTNELTGLDDYFFRVIPSTRQFAGLSASHHYNALGLRRLQLVYDTRNRAYTESWLKDFSEAFSALGGKLLSPIEFASSEDLGFEALARKVLAGKPDGIVLMANSVDAAMLTQHIRKLNASISIGASEWAATERLIELGGRSVEGMAIAQFFDRQNTQPAYLAFREAFIKRFNQEPGYAGLLAFDAANILFDALEKKQKNQSLKQALLSIRSFSGTQGPIVFDTTGDTRGETFMVTIKDGRFITIPTRK